MCGGIQYQGDKSWARLDSIKTGKWKPWHSRSALIPADGFMEKDSEKQSHWIAFQPGRMIQALLAERNDGRRVYIVTEETPPDYRCTHDCRPRLVQVTKPA
ncbi:SOS response-associated peptidase [Nitrosomonas sp. Nm58]|uniref:SOS response-associated peptidase n=1 Tax=Nitrosomonas sp. Nm58 TaxID=200126 RepID=UPI0008945980|nr:SOS response-associated peptidase [Nitrosomonas sp. Nm58]SDY96790.1 hypothetical protein SAMN05421754_103616 [Nitrosomonas sp. Nm58]